jgi:glutamate-1-semialdehyde 2,1-aminomutase
MTAGGNAAIARRAAQVTPGGVHSPVRAFTAVGVPPLAIVEAKGARVRDPEGREYVDWIGAWGPALFGHGHAGIVRAVTEAAGHGLLFGLVSPPEVALCERITALVPPCEMVRLTVSGTEATMSAVRLARAATRRPALLKFSGCYHGHADSFLIRAGSGAATFGAPDSPGVSRATARDTLVARYNDLEDVDRCFREVGESIAAIIVEPVAGNMGCVPPEPEFLPGLRERCDRHGTLLIFDEIITGFRLGPGGAAERFGVRPDLITLGKVLGGGMPLAAFGGRRDLMELISPGGPVYQGGTYTAHPLSVAAALAALDALALDSGIHLRLEQVTESLAGMLREAARDAGLDRCAAPLQFQHTGSLWTSFFSTRPIRSWDDAARADTRAYARFFRGMLARGILLPPSSYECAFVSTAHGDEEIARTVAAAREAFREVLA